MTIGEMLGQSGLLALMGVGTVFMFLITMIIVVSLLGRILNPDSFKKNSASQDDQAALSISTPENTSDSSKITAAISAAVTEYRKSH